MEKLRIDDVDHPPTISPADVLRPLSGPLGAENVAINYFELAPSERFGFDYHRHLDQEEVFYVQQGTVTFETSAARSGANDASGEPPSERPGEVEVAAGEAIRFAPGEFQIGRNLGDERVVALAIGAPRDSEAIEYHRACPDCDERTIQVPELDDGAPTIRIRCTACDAVVDEFEF